MERKHVAVLPDTINLDSKSDPPRFLRLPHPRSRERALWLPHVAQDGKDALLEVQRVDPGEEAGRSYFVQQEVLSDGTLTILTAFDPAFIIISLLSQLPPHFLPLDELFEAASIPPFRVAKLESEGDVDMDDDGRDCEEDIVRFGKLPCVAARLTAVCETTEHDSTTLYRFSPALALALLQSKVTQLTDPVSGLFGPYEPTGEGVSKEEGPKAVNGAESKAAASEFPTVLRGLGREGLGLGEHSEALQLEARQKCAIAVVANYLAAPLAQTLLDSYKFPLLAAYLLANTGSASAVLSHTYLPGRASAINGTREADNALGGGNAAQLAKKKKEAAKGSRGVEALKKVNTKGMRSLKDMFGKPPAKK